MFVMLYYLDTLITTSHITKSLLKQSLLEMTAICRVLTNFSAAVSSMNLEPWPGLPGQEICTPTGRYTLN